MAEDAGSLLTMNRIFFYFLRLEETKRRDCRTAPVVNRSSLCSSNSNSPTAWATLFLLYPPPLPPPSCPLRRPAESAPHAEEVAAPSGRSWEESLLPPPDVVEAALFELEKERLARVKVRLSAGSPFRFVSLTILDLSIRIFCVLRMRL